MAREETGDRYDIDAMDDAELRALIVETLREQLSVDAGTLELEVEDGRVMLSGRVGTEDELEAIERLILDRVGVTDLENGLVVDELVRDEADEAADAPEHDDRRLARRSRTDATEPSAEHLVDDVEGDLYGTEDLQKAIEQGEAYTPPDDPHEEGTRSLEDH